MLLTVAGYLLNQKKILNETQEDMYYYAVMALYSTYIAKKEEGADE